MTQRALDDADGHPMPPEVYADSRGKLLTRLEDVQAKLKEAAAAESASSVEFLPVVAGLLAEWDTFPVGRRRDLLATVVDRVIVDRPEPHAPCTITVVPVWEARQAIPPR